MPRLVCKLCYSGNIIAIHTEWLYRNGWNWNMMITISLFHLNNKTHPTKLWSYPRIEFSIRTAMRTRKIINQIKRQLMEIYYDITDVKTIKHYSQIHYYDVIMTSEIPAQMASNAEYISIWWLHHDCSELSLEQCRCYRLRLNIGPDGVLTFWKLNVWCIGEISSNSTMLFTCKPVH